MVVDQFDFFLKIGFLGFELLLELYYFGRSLFNQLLKVLFVIFTFGHILDGQ